MAAPGSFHSESGRRIARGDDHTRRDEFTKLLVFSFTTLSGAVGGHLAPATSLTAMLASLEALMGLIYLAVVIARLVAMRSDPPEATVEEGRGFV